MNSTEQEVPNQQLRTQTKEAQKLANGFMNLTPRQQAVFYNHLGKYGSNMIHIFLTSTMQPIADGNSFQPLSVEGKRAINWIQDFHYIHKKKL